MTLKRKKPMKRGTKRLKRSRLKHTSERYAKIKRETDPERAAFVEAVGTCMRCGCKAVLCHEITCGTYAREQALRQPRMQMALCPVCHDAFHKDPYWTKERQLAIRAVWELEQFCNEFNANRGRAPTAFTFEELLTYMMYRDRPQP